MVRYLTYYDNQKLPIRLSYRVFKGLKEELKTIDMSKLDDLDPELMETMLWFGLKSGHAAEKKPFEMKKEDMEDILDECMIEFLNLIPEFFPEAKMGNVLKNLGNQNQTEETSEPIQGSIV